MALSSMAFNLLAKNDYFIVRGWDFHCHCDRYMLQSNEWNHMGPIQISGSHYLCNNDKTLVYIMALLGSSRDYAFIGFCRTRCPSKCRWMPWSRHASWCCMLQTMHWVFMHLCIDSYVNLRSFRRGSTIERARHLTYVLLT